MCANKLDLDPPTSGTGLFETADLFDGITEIFFVQAAGKNKGDSAEC